MFVGLVAVGVQEQAEDILFPPLPPEQWALQ